ncbi:hypothetical protein CCU68_33270 [Pseudomonas gingeri NCPPB 3146 = LMG 5327]|uniref:Type II toxin-antitoxin system VapC family toxin n=1 Tax=Pseudomonas gingeri NCPPB 3146 = LMG 5327 TaxID=707248 RepID=A0ABX4XTS4_9PSED|nr:hypothetical protein CCU68_33270 [Pseudomonas gingeri NCPPB 3146 = LMG 5327]
MGAIKLICGDSSGSVPYFTELATAGTPLGPCDQMIAGHARSQGLIRVTNNSREFDRVPGLRIEDWVSETQAPGQV